MKKKRHTKRVVRLHAPKYAHSYWQRNKYDVQMPDGSFLDRWQFYKGQIYDGLEVEVHERPEGLFVQYFSCSSGGGKAPINGVYLLLPSSEYDEIEYVSRIPDMAQSLIDEIADNDLPI